MKEIVLFVTLAFNVMAQSKSGVLDSLESQLEVHQKRFLALLKKSEQRQVYISGLNSTEKLEIAPLFIQSILLYSKKQYLNLMKTNDCAFYALLENNLLRTVNGTVYQVPITHDKKKLIIPKEELIRHIYKTKCFKNRDISELFNKTNFIKTIKSLKFDIPSNDLQCKEIHQRWIVNPYLPYLCQVPETLSEASRRSKNYRAGQSNLIFSKANNIKKELSFFTRTYLYNICKNIDDQHSFCSLYTSDDVWRKVINGELPQYLQKYNCKDLMPKLKLDNVGLNRCRSVLLESPQICEMGKKGNHLSLIPKPNCNMLSDALKHSNLKTDYHDCPVNITNEAITNVHRILMHLRPHKIRSDPANCASEANYSFARLSIDYNKQESWPLKVCFPDPISEKKKCMQYIPGNHPTSPLSETRIIANILERIINAPPGLKCKSIDSQSYNPGLLKYRNGCFIVFNSSNCKQKKCGKKIFFKNKVIKKIKYTGKANFDYFATSYKNEKLSFISMLLKLYKIKSKPLRNLTEITMHLKNKNRIIHGIGCSQDLLPRFFRKKTFNDCTPLPFIVDGLIRKDDQVYLSTRTAIDDLHSPRLLIWSRVFTSVANYKELQPLERWTLHGLR